MTKPAPVARPVNPVPPEGTPVLLIIERSAPDHAPLVELGERALPGVRVIAVSDLGAAYAVFEIHGHDILGVITHLRISGGPKRLLSLMNELDVRAPWGILTGVKQPPLPEEFMPRPPLAVQAKNRGVTEMLQFFRHFAPAASPATGEATAL